MPTPETDPLIELLRDAGGSPAPKQVHDYLASHPEEARALRIRFGQPCVSRKETNSCISSRMDNL